MTDDPVVKKHRDLEQIAMVALEVGKLLSETGAKTGVISAGMRKIAMGLGAEHFHSRVGYASLAVTVTSGGIASTRMIDTGSPGVNMRLNHELRELCREVQRGRYDVAALWRRIAELRANTPHHPPVAMMLAAGIACAAFGRLLGVDWVAMPAIVVASFLGQWLRMTMTRKRFNAFVVVFAVAFLAAIVAGSGAILAGSQMVPTAMTASVLMLVPGIPAVNAQTDIMEGYPTMGSARFMVVMMILMFITLGIGAAEMINHAGGGDKLALEHGVAHQALFGAIAAAGFGVLFNFGANRLFWAAVAGALALAVRSLALDAGWYLEAASFTAAAVVALAVELLRWGAFDVRRPRGVIAVAGCIPMVPGGAATKSLLGLIELTSQSVGGAVDLQAAMGAGLRVVFTIAAIGAGLTMMRSLMPHSEFP